MRQEYRDKQNNQPIRHPDTQSNKHDASENVSIKRINFICSIDFFFLSCPCSVLVCFVVLFSFLTLSCPCSVLVCFIVLCSTQYISDLVLSLFCSGLFYCVLFHTIPFLTLSCPWSVLVCSGLFCCVLFHTILFLTLSCPCSVLVCFGLFCCVLFHTILFLTLSVLVLFWSVLLCSVPHNTISDLVLSLFCSGLFWSVLLCSVPHNTLLTLSHLTGCRRSDTPECFHGNSAGDRARCQ